MIKVLYIEDNKFDRIAFTRFMGKVENINYQLCNSIEEARALIHQQPFDIIVTDYSLADGTAFDVLEAAKENNVPVIVTTGTGSEEIAVKLMRQGARDYLLKDIDNNYLKILPVVIENTLKHIKDQNELLKKEVELEQSLELQARKDEFVGIASHELKTPLTSLKAYVQLIKRQVDSDATIDRSKIVTQVTRAEQHISRLEYLIGNLLDLSKITAGKIEYDFQWFSLKDMVSDCIESIKHLAIDHKVTLEGMTELTIKGDKLRLEQVLTNYLTNAVKYAPNSDKIIVGISKDENNVIVSVKDYGIGISADVKEKIFDRFFRAKNLGNQFAGLGVGLYISKEIIERHNGKVWVDSEPDKGSTFYFSLPIENK